MRRGLSPLQAAIARGERLIVEMLGHFKCGVTSIKWRGGMNWFLHLRGPGPFGMFACLGRLASNSPNLLESRRTNPL